jgi:hypothetical protein
VSLVRRLAVIQFERAAKSRSRWPRAMAFAAVGAAEVLSVEPRNSAALRLLTDYAATVSRLKGNPDWPWPEPRLTYANAILPEAMIAAGVALGDTDLRQRGLDLLEWLLDYETATSRPPAAGRGPQDSRPPSTNSRSRWPPSPTRAHAPRPSMRGPSGRRNPLCCSLVPDGANA